MSLDAHHKLTFNTKCSSYLYLYWPKCPSIFCKPRTSCLTSHSIPSPSIGTNGPRPRYRQRCCCCHLSVTLFARRQPDLDRADSRCSGQPCDPYCPRWRVTAGRKLPCSISCSRQSSSAVVLIRLSSRGRSGSAAPNCETGASGSWRIPLARALTAVESACLALVDIANC